MARRETATSLDGSVQAGEGMIGSTVVVLPAGDHTVALEWRPTGEAPADWAGLLSLFDGFAGATITMAEASSQNSPPVARIPVSIREANGISLYEDEPVRITGLHVTDPDSELEPRMAVRVQLSVSRGTLILGMGA